jgi:ABC-2 type transport system permease protein
MLNDIKIIVWKEWKELLRFQGGGRSGMVGILIMVAVFAIFMPIQWGRMWVDSAAPLSMWVVIPLILVGSMVADSIAGERERHTLETLLATRLSDQAILLGKILASVVYVWLVTQLVFMVALIPLNIVHGEGELLVYPWDVLWSGLLLSFLLASLMSNIGVLVSLRAETVKQVQQKLGISTFVVAYLVPMAGVYALRYVPEEMRERLFQPILSGDIGMAVLLASLVLILINIGLFLASKARFQRTRLVIDV